MPVWLIEMSARFLSFPLPLLRALIFSDFDWRVQYSTLAISLWLPLLRLVRLGFRDFSSGCAVGLLLVDLLFFVGERCRVTLTEDLPPCLRKPIFLVVFGVFEALDSLVKRLLIPYFVLLFLFPVVCLVIVQKSSTLLFVYYNSSGA